MHGCTCPFAIDTRISASNTACDRNSPIKMCQIHSQKSIIERISTDSMVSISCLEFVERKAFDTPGSVLVGVHVDYRQNAKLFEKVYEGSIL